MVFKRKGYIALLLSISLVLPMSATALAEERVDLTPTKMEQEAIEKEQSKGFYTQSTKVYENAHEQVDFGYSEILLDKVMQFEKDNPNASQSQINDYFMEIASIYNRNNPDNTIEPNDDSGLVTLSSITENIYEFVGGKAGLNSQEQELFNSDPSRGLKAITAGKEAQDYTYYKFGRNGRGDKTDAFRHSAWNIWIVGFTGSVGWAKTWTDAHETGASSVENPPIEFNMDINNNIAGRQQAMLDNITADSSVNATRSAIDKAYKSGKLEYIPNYKVDGKGTRTKFTGTSSDYII